VEDYFELYFEYAGVGIGEAPTIFHRWTSVAIIGALLGRQFHFPFGHSEIYPNQYIMFMGSPGSRKSTAINTGVKLLKAAGYNRFAADRTSKERFLIDMKQVDEGALDEENLDILTLDEPAEIFVVAEEFTDFVGNNNMDFITCLTKLWDNPSEYKHPKIHGKSVLVHQPTVNIISGNTAQGFSLAFPPEAIGNGFLSRLIFVHGETTGRKVTFPPQPDALVKATLAERLKSIKKHVRGEAQIAPGLDPLFTEIYGQFKGIDDHRFKHYSTRRFTHLLKLSMIIAASDMSLMIKEDHVLKANTLLHYTETKMPKALGEYGKSKYSDISNTILAVLNDSHHPMTLNQLWKKVANDLAKVTELAEVMKNLQLAGKIQAVSISGKQGFLPLHEESVKWKDHLIMESWLTAEEKL
jgi:hypothetical protein